MLIGTNAFTMLAQGIERPEDVIATRDGRVYAAHHPHCIAAVRPDGGFDALGPRIGAPNGLAMDLHQRVIIANFGIFDQQPGPLQRFDPATGVLETLVAAIDGKTLTSCNYPAVDAQGNIWCTHSTYEPTFIAAMLNQTPDGFVFVVTPDLEVRVVATGLAFPNGCAISPDGAHLYVCRTSTADVVRFPILPGPALGAMELVCDPLGAVAPPGTKLLETSHEFRLALGYTDGCAFDAEGGLWIALPAGNKVVRLRPDGEIETMLSDPTGKIINHPTNISWGGPDLDQLYLGSIVMRYIPTAKSPIPGFPKIHQL
jgi:gluconolactonase